MKKKLVSKEEIETLQLDEYEQEWLENLRSNNLQPSKTSKEAKMLIAASKKHQQKTERANIRVAKWVLDEIKYQASKLGMPYQTYMSSILYRHAQAY